MKLSILLFLLSMSTLGCGAKENHNQCWYQIHAIAPFPTDPYLLEQRLILEKIYGKPTDKFYDTLFDSICEDPS